MPECAKVKTGNFNVLAPLISDFDFRFGPLSGRHVEPGPGPGPGLSSPGKGTAAVSTSLTMKIPPPKIFDIHF